MQARTKTTTTTRTTNNPCYPESKLIFKYTLLSPPSPFYLVNVSAIFFFCKLNIKSLKQQK